MHVTPERTEQQPLPDTSSQRSGACHTPQECATMVDAVEQAIQHAQECTPDSHRTGSTKAANLQEWLRTSGLDMPTPAARDLQALVEAAADNRRLRRQLEALREAELELAAREAEETAVNFSMLEDENMDLASRNAQLEKRIAELEALAAAAEAAAQAHQQQREASPEPFTPQQQRVRGPGLGDDAADVQERATSVLKRAAAARRLSGMYEEEQQAKLRELNAAEGRLSAMKAQAAPGSTQSQQAAVQQRLSAAEQQVKEAAAAAEEATAKLAAVQQEKEAVQGELAALRRQLDAQPLAAAQHAELYTKLLEAQQQLLQEKQQHQHLAGTLLEHAGRLSHKYFNLSDDYDELEHRYHSLTEANRRLSSQLKEAHEALFEVQTAVQATPVHKRREQHHLLTRLQAAEETVKALADEKQQLQERLLQAHAFISCLQQRTEAAAATAARARQPGQAALLQTPSAATDDTPAGATPWQDSSRPDAAASAVVPCAGKSEAGLALPAPAAADAPCSNALVSYQPAVASGAGLGPDSSSTPVRGHCNPLFDLPATPSTQLVSLGPGAAHAATAPGVHAWPHEPISPILAAATRSSAVGEQRQRLQRDAASHELQDVQLEQLGLRQEISRAKSALADIAGQLRASIGSAAAAGQPYGASDSASSAGHLAFTSQQQSTAARGGDAGSASSSRSHGAFGQKVERPAAQASSSGSSGAARASHPSSSKSQGSKAASAAAAAVHAPGRLQELHKAAAAVKSASAAFSGSSSSKGSSVASRGARPAADKAESAAASRQQGAARIAAGSRAAAASRGGDRGIRQCDEVSSSGSSSKGATAGQRPRPYSHSSLGAAAAGHSPAHSSHSGAGAAAAGLSAGAAGVESGSGRGSISLDQLIADAESVSLEYGMSPGPAAGAASAAEVVSAGAPAAAVAAQASTLLADRWAHSSATPAQQQDQQQRAEAEPGQFAFVPGGQLLATPGSAASSAGQAAVPHRPWAAPQYDATPATAAGAAAGVQLPDMQSCMRSAGAAAVYSDDSTPWRHSHQQGASAAATPAGMERVASNSMLDALDAAAEAADGQQGLRTTPQQQQVTPTSVAGIRSGAAADTSVLQQQDYKAARASTFAASSLVAAMLGAALSSQASADASGLGQGTQCAEQQPGEQSEQVTPAKASPPAVSFAAGAEAPTGAAAAAGGMSSPPSALKKAAAALLSSISPAGVAASAAATPAAATAAAGGAALSPLLLQHVTPEWLRSLKRKCKQESEQLQQLRRQMGLATLDPQLVLCEQEQPQQTPLAAAQAPATMQQGEQAAVDAAAWDLCAPTDASGPQQAAPAAGHQDCATPLVSTADVATPACTGDSSASKAAAEAGTSGSANRAAAPSSSGPSLGQLSSRSSIDRLRRRAIMSQAAAAASPTPEVDAAADMSAASPAAAVAAAAGGVAAAPCQESNLGRTSSSGSLAEYMRQTRMREESAPVSRAGSVTPAVLMARPECPTPGSTYSEAVNAELGAAAGPLSGRESSVSPDLLLAGLRSSRLAARQLQQQLMQHLEKTTSLPSLLLHTQPDEAVDAAAVECPRASSAVAAALANSGVAGTDLAPAGGVGSPVLVATELEAAGSASSQQAFEFVPHALAAGAAAAGSPLTPGAALNAESESRLLSPSMQLQLVFDDDCDDATTAPAAGAAAQSASTCSIVASVLEAEQQAAQAANTPAAGSSLLLQPQQQQELQPVTQLRSYALQSCSPMESDGSSCMLPVGVAAKAQPRTDSAVAAPSPPASALTVTPGLPAPTPQGSIRAHQLSSVSAGTVTASALTAADAALTPEGQAASSHDATSACARGRSSALAPAPASSCSQGSVGASASSQAGASAGPSLGSWASRGTAGAAQAALQQAGDSPASIAAPTPAAAAAEAEENCGTAQRLGAVASSMRQQQEVVRTPAVPIALGESPSSRPQQQHSRAAPQEAAAAAGAAEMPFWAADSASLTSGSCLSASQASGNRPSLGASPGSASQVQSAAVTPDTAAAAAAALPQAAAVPAADSGAVAAASAALQAAFGAPSAQMAGAAGLAAAGGSSSMLSASAALSAAFAAAPQPAASNAPHAPSAAPAAAAGGAAPAASSTSCGSGSCMFVTPAAAFGSPTTTYGACSDSDAQQYYTGLQNSSLSRHTASTAATYRHRAAETTDTTQEAAAGVSGSGPDVAFAGFRVLAQAGAAEAEAADGSPVVGGTVAATATAAVGGAGDAAAGAAAGDSRAGPAVPTATAQKRALQELLASPSNSGSSGQDSPQSPAQQQQQQHLTGSGNSGEGDSPAGRAAAGREHEAAGAGGAQLPLQMASPTLSELGFVTASASADVADAKRLQQQQQEQAGLAAVRKAAADLAGLSFEQRLELLCSEDAVDGEEEEATDCAEDVLQPLQQPLAAEADAAAAARDGSTVKAAGGSGGSSSSSKVDASTAVGTGLGAEEQETALTEAQGVSGMACCGTQTSPLPSNFASALRGYGEAPEVRDAGVQVPTPTHGPQPKLHAASSSNSGAAVSSTKPTQQPRPRPCDVTASPIKGRDQC